MFCSEQNVCLLSNKQIQSLLFVCFVFIYLAWEVIYLDVASMGCTRHGHSHTRCQCQCHSPGDRDYNTSSVLFFCVNDLRVVFV